MATGETGGHAYSAAARGRIKVEVGVRICTPKQNEFIIFSNALEPLVDFGGKHV